ncbi:uncharacterized protein LOC121372976 [Gigantopelta aegis]|uniref:uncharacterized protein LOC121372976 n=1 Tax=Gigantopelta aegis TaxID=1735272 RepID=UPI001B887E99|nr:uncharacterized protein LOC121372976 [Gigantopelta aegis]
MGKWLCLVILAGIMCLTAAEMCPVRPVNCAELKELGMATEDGEYDLYPPILNGEAVFIYCHNMTGTPVEYLTLLNYNGGNHPNLGNKNCNGEGVSPIPANSGSSSFSKIRVDITTMEVDGADYTFAETTGKPIPWGQAADCYSIHYGGNKSPCGIKGLSVIDTTDTGLMLDPSITWQKTGWNGFAEVTKSTTGQTISLLCGGWCGGCKATGPLKLIVTTTDLITASPTSCMDVKENDFWAEDGDYVLFPDSLGDQGSTFYCHNMATAPQEYVPLSVPNTGQHPNIGNRNCNGETTSPKPELSGSSSFTKIRVHIKNMDVDRTDYTFATTTGKPVPYGEASDCYSIHYGGNKSSCGMKGDFTIDTTGMDFVIDPTLTWSAFGWNPFEEVNKTSNGRIVSLHCGGWCGGCRPDSLLTLSLA